MVSSLDALALSAPVASNDSTKIYYKLNYSGTPTYFRFFLDTDAKAGTGYSISGIGANYLIENGNLYKFSGSSITAWNWTFVKTIAWSQASGIANASLLKTDLGSPSKILLVAQVSAPTDTSSVVTEVISSASPILVTPSISSPIITSDASSATIKFTYSGVSGVYDDAFIDSDGNTSSGYSINGIGADYLIENSTLYKFSGANSSTWGWTAVKAISFTGATGSASFTVARADIGTPSAIKVVGQAQTPSVVSAAVSATLAPVAPSPSPSPSPTASPSLVSYTASSANIPNPERGFDWMTDCRANPIGVAQMQNYRATSGHSVVHCMWYLRDFKSSPISSTVLSQLSTQLDNVRAAGFKVILRFAYTDTDTNDAPLSVVSNHLDQMASILQKNSDIITTVQAGIIGQWGEMQASANFGGPSTSTDWANRKAVIDKLLSVLPANRMVSVRTPQFKSNPYGSTPLSQSEAYTGTSRARVGFFDDCLISSPNDWGTFTSAADLPFLQNDSKYVTTSGETCALATDNDCSNALSSLASRHWTHLHEGYNSNVITKWDSQGCLPTIRQKLGYRFQLDSAMLPSVAKVGGAIALSFNIENVGFAAPYNPRGFELVLKNSSTGAIYHVALKTDPRVWQPGAVTVNESVTLPASIPAGTYSMWLNLPDPAPALYGLPYYSIQLANTGLWDQSTGFNNLNHNLMISN
jgi:hypothetical protein